MKTIKPQTLGVLTRPFEFQRRFYLGVATLCFVPVDDATALLPEKSMWPFLAKALPKEAVDAAIPKAHGEFLAVATAYAPGGKPVTSLRAGIMLGERRKIFQIIGPRLWDGRRASEPTPFTEMDIRWDLTYGGEGYADNPLGLGAKAAEATPETPAKLPTVLAYSPEARDQQRPVSLGSVDQMWPARASLAGTHDKKWLDTQFPGFAGDIDWRFFNTAQPDQQFETMLNGDETYAFENLHPERPLIKGTLPGIMPRAFIDRDEENGFTEVKLALSTVWFFPGALRMVLVHHGRVPVRHELALDVTRLVLGADKRGEPRPAAYFKSIMDKRLDKKNGAAAAMRDADLVPAEWLVRDEAAEASRKEMESERLPQKRARRKAEAEYDKAIAGLVAQGVDLSKVDIPKMPEPEPVPTLDELPAYAARKMAEAEALKAEALEKAAAAEAELDGKLRDMGKSEQEIAAARIARSAKPSGPPKLPAASVRKPLEQAADRQREAAAQAKTPEEKQKAQARLEETEAKLADPALQTGLHSAGVQIADSYLKTAHFQDPAAKLSAADSTIWRNALITGGTRSWQQIDLCGADLRGIDLRMRDLSGIWLDHADLTGANLAGANLSNAVLAHACLKDCKLDGANLTGANLGGTSMPGASFKAANLTKAILSKADLSGADFAGADVSDAQMMETIFGDGNFAGLKAPGLKILKTSLAGFKAAGIQLEKAVFLDCDLTKADFSGAHMRRTAFLNCKLNGAKFKGAAILKGCFTGTCDASGADFSEADLTGINLRGITLKAANFTRANLTGADLTGADLSDATLLQVNAIRAHFADALLPRAVLRAGNFKKGDFARADLRGADLRDAGAYEANLARAMRDKDTRVKGMQTTRMRFLPLYEPPEKAAV